MTKGFDELIVSAPLFSDYKMFIEYSNKAERKNTIDRMWFTETS